MVKETLTKVLLSMMAKETYRSTVRTVIHDVKRRTYNSIVIHDQKRCVCGTVEYSHIHIGHLVHKLVGT